MTRRMRSVALSVAVPVALLAALATTPAPAMASDVATPPARWPAPATTLDPALLQAPYALVTRPLDDDRPDGVDLVMLDPRTRAPLTRSPLALDCQRVSAAATGRLACFNQRPATVGGAPRASLSVHAPTLAPLSRRASPAGGLPNRLRVSPNGTLAATTEFVAGHGYAGTAGASFSTATLLWRLDGPQPPQDLQGWPLYAHGARVTAVDLNLWGVTFDPRDPDHFLVTAAFGGRPYLAEGHVAAQHLDVLRPDVECPSYSPDGRRIGFKQRRGATGWSPAVLDLALGTVRAIDVGTSVDDQVAWLDDHTLLYEVVRRPLVGQASSDLMALDVDAVKPVQRVWLAHARSPSVVGWR